MNKANRKQMRKQRIFLNHIMTLHSEPGILCVIRNLQHRLMQRRREIVEMPSLQMFTFGSAKLVTTVNKITPKCHGLKAAPNNVSRWSG